jgi:hypothetical protein
MPALALAFCCLSRRPPNFLGLRRSAQITSAGGDLLELKRGRARWLKRIPLGGQYHDLPRAESVRTFFGQMLTKCVWKLTTIPRLPEPDRLHHLPCWNTPWVLQTSGTSASPLLAPPGTSVGGPGTPQGLWSRCEPRGPPNHPVHTTGGLWDQFWRPSNTTPSPPP